MKRSIVIDLLNNYKPVDQQEQKTKNRMIEFVKNYKNCFERSLEIGHITASAWLLNKTGTHALLMHHAKMDQWFQVGGHCDGVSDVVAVALKEAREESGITHLKPVSHAIFDIDIHTIPEYKGTPAHEHYDIRFLLQVTSDEQVVQNSESKELRWIAKESKQTDLPTLEPSIIRMFNKWIKRS